MVPLRLALRTVTVTWAVPSISASLSECHWHADGQLEFSNLLAKQKVRLRRSRPRRPRASVCYRAPRAGGLHVDRGTVAIAARAIARASPRGPTTSLASRACQ